MHALGPPDSPEPAVVALRERLRAAIAPEVAVVDRPEVRALFSRDLGEVPAFLERGLFRTLPDLVVQPRSIDDVARAVRFADREGVPIVPRGAASWGFGGCVPTRGGIVFDFSTWQDVSEAASGEVAVAPGARWGEIERVLSKGGFTLGVYPSNRFATVGGWIATGGYGLMSGGHGHVSDWVTEITVVTPEHGPRVHRKGEREHDLFFGSEGQLGVLAAARVRGRERPAFGSPRLFLASDGAALSTLLSKALDAGVALGHAKYLDARHVAALDELWRAERPGKLLDPADALLCFFESAGDETRFRDLAAGATGISEAPFWVASYLWEDRFNPLRVQLLGPSLLASESIVPLAALAEYERGADRLASGFAATIYHEAHLVKDGAAYRWLLLPMIPCDRRDGRRYATLLPLVALLTRLGVKLGGRPYGVGIWNTPFVKNRFSPSELDAIAAMKRRDDPRGVLNPGKFFALGTRLGGIPGIAMRPAIVGAGLALLDGMLPVLAPLRTGGGQAPAFRHTSSEAAGDLSIPGHYPASMPEDRFLEKTLLGCTQCGNCIVVCPAYQVSLDEGTTARAKLRIAGKLLASEPVTKHESDTAFICTHCGECERVCQTHLPLVRAWDAIEGRLASRHGRPEEAIKSFVDSLGTHPSYLKMIGSDPYRSGAPVSEQPHAPTWAAREVASGKLPGPRGQRREDPWARVTLPAPRGDRT
ncbi:MAG: FAD-binding protein [Acidobacteriota bacterium]